MASGPRSAVRVHRALFGSDGFEEIFPAFANFTQSYEGKTVALIVKHGFGGKQWNYYVVGLERASSIQCSSTLYNTPNLWSLRVLLSGSGIGSSWGVGCIVDAPVGCWGPFDSTQGPGASFQELLGQGVRGLGAPVSLRLSARSE